jgi:putative DNA primase/helicase
MTALSLDQIARATGGRVYRDLVRAPAPGKGKGNDSLVIWLSPHRDCGFRLVCHNGTDPDICEDHVRSCLGLPPWRPGQPGRPVPDPARLNAVMAAASRAEAQVDANRTAGALAIWSRARDPRPTDPMMVYLRHRRVADLLPPGCLGETLRWHPDGLMVALVRNIHTDAPQAIHRTFLTPDGEKFDRKSLGPVGGGAVKLTPDPEVHRSIGVGEGLETTLSLRGLPDHENLAVWSLIDAGQLGRFPAIEGVETLFVAVDHDPPGILAARSVAATWLNAGREVRQVLPNAVGTDLNDARQPDA